MSGHAFMKKIFFTINRSKHITLCTFRMFQNVLFKTVQFVNNIIQAVNHVLFNFSISQLRNDVSFVHSFQKEEKRRNTKKKKRKKVQSFILITKTKKENHSFIHSFFHQLEKQYRRRKEGKNKLKILKVISIKTSSSIVHYYLSSYFFFSIFIYFYS